MSQNNDNQKITAGRIILGWLLQHKAIVVIVLLVLYILVWPKHFPDNKVVQAETPQVTTAAQKQPQPTQPPTATQPVTPQSAADIMLYAPDEENADPKWGLPVELKTEEIQNLMQQVGDLHDKTQELVKKEGAFDNLVTTLIGEETIDHFWARARKNGFRDKQLPLDWYEVVKERNSLVGLMGAYTDLFVNQAVQVALTARLNTIRVRTIGGKVVVGDMLFVKGFQAYVDQRHAYYTKLLPLAQGVVQRLQKEFSGQVRSGNE